jgi:hypothetical protein
MLTCPNRRMCPGLRGSGARAQRRAPGTTCPVQSPRPGVRVELGVGGCQNRRRAGRHPEYHRDSVWDGSKHPPRRPQSEQAKGSASGHRRCGGGGERRIAHHPTSTRLWSRAEAELGGGTTSSPPWLRLPLPKGRMEGGRGKKAARCGERAAGADSTFLSAAVRE